MLTLDSLHEVGGLSVRALVTMLYVGSCLVFFGKGAKEPIWIVTCRPVLVKIMG